jgi:hypothetical protein
LESNLCASALKLNDIGMTSCPTAERTNLGLPVCPTRFYI